MADLENTPADSIIICEDVHKWFDDFHVLKGITTTFKRGGKGCDMRPFGVG